MRIASIGLAAACWLWTAPAMAQEWRLASHSDTSVSYVDAQSVRRSGDQVTYWETMIFVTPLETGVTRVLGRFEANCRDHSSNLVFRTFFRGRDAEESGPGTQGLQHFGPGTLGALTIDAACSGRWRSEPIADPESDAPGRIAR